MIIKKRLQEILFILGLLFIFILLNQSWKTITPIFFSINWIACITSIFIAISGNFFIALLYKHLLQKYGENIETGLAIRLFFYGQIAKYIPGKIWTLWYQRTHLNSPHATATIIFANIDLMGVILSIISSTSISLLLFGHSIVTAGAIFFSGLILAFYLVTSCKIPCILAKTVSSLFSKNMEAFNCKNNITTPFQTILLILIFLLTYISSNATMLYAIFDLSFKHTLEILAILGVSWIIGMISIVSPGGIGIREASFIFIGGYISETPASIELLASISIISRIWLIIQELLGVIIVAAFDPKLKS